MPARRSPHGLTAPQTACLLEAGRAGLLVLQEDGRYRRWCAPVPVPSFQARVVASLVKRGHLARRGEGGRAASVTRAGLELYRAVEQELHAAALARIRNQARAQEAGRRRVAQRLQEAQGPRARGLAARHAHGGT